MATSSTGQKVLVESDFLFGLRQSDRRHENVLRALARHSRGNLTIRVLSSAVAEVRTVLYSRGLGPKESEDVLSLMGAMLAEHGVQEYLPIEIADVVVAERLRADQSQLGFFDSLHAATSKRLGIPVLSSEGAYTRLGLAVLDLDEQ